MAGSSPFTVMANIFVTESPNSVKTFRENARVFFHTELLKISDIDKYPYLRARLHQASASSLRQLCKDASDTALIENNGVAPD